MKNINVVAAIIIKNNKIFITQRGYGEFKDYWEFPGGKIENGETKEEALIREIKEELNTNITVKKLLTIVEYDYPKFHLTMSCFICNFEDNNFNLVEAEDYKFIDVNELDSIDFLPADILTIKKIKQYFNENQ